MSCISLKVLVVSILLNLLIMPISSLLSIMFGYLALVTSTLFPIELFRYNEVCVNKKQFSIILAFAGIVCLNSFFSLTVIQANEFEEFIKALFSFFAFLLAIAAKGIMYTERDLKFFFSVTRIFAVIMILYTIIPFDFQYIVVDSYGSKQFTLSMGNPNATAIKILFSIILLCIENSILKSNHLRFFNDILIVGLFYIIIRLQSRTVFICALICIVYSMILKFKIKKWMTSWVWIVPAIFIPIQLIFAKLPLFNLLDKSSATGRETLFADYLGLISYSPSQFILGDFAEYQLENNHNIFFLIVFNFGFVGLILFLWFWKIECHAVGSTTTKLAQYAWMGWIVLVIHSMAEASVLSGSFTFGAILILLNRMTKDTLILLPESESIYVLTPKEKYVKAS